MSQVLESSTNRKSAPELQVLFKFPVLDYNCHRQATDGPMLDSSARVSVDVEHSVLKPAKPASSNVKFGGGDHNIKPRVADHVWSRETCAQHGCKECCGCVAQQSQCDSCAEENIFALSQQIHEASLHEWNEIERSEGDGFIETGLEEITHDMTLSDLHQEPVTSFEQEVFEIVDGRVEMELVDGRVIKLWIDTMDMEDCGY